MNMSTKRHRQTYRHRQTECGSHRQAERLTDTDRLNAGHTDRPRDLQTQTD